MSLDDYTDFPSLGIDYGFAEDTAPEFAVLFADSLGQQAGDALAMSQMTGECGALISAELWRTRAANLAVIAWQLARKAAA